MNRYEILRKAAYLKERHHWWSYESHPDHYWHLNRVSKAPAGLLEYIGKSKGGERFKLFKTRCRINNQADPILRSMIEYGEPLKLTFFFGENILAVGFEKEGMMEIFKFSDLFNLMIFFGNVETLRERYFKGNQVVDQIDGYTNFDLNGDIAFTMDNNLWFIPKMNVVGAIV